MYTLNETVNAIQIMTENNLIQVEQWKFGVIIKSYYDEEDENGKIVLTENGLLFLPTENIASFIKAINKLKPKKKNKKAKRNKK